MTSLTGIVVSVNRSATHSFSKPATDRIRLIAGLGVEDDAHMGRWVKHRTLVRRDPSRPNLRQVHLLSEERLAELRAAGFALVPGEIGENVTTRGIDLLSLPAGAHLRLGPTAVIEVTGLRNPCRQLDAHQSGLTAAMLGTDEDGNIVRKAGIMSIVLEGGEVAVGDAIRVVLPPEPHRKLDRV